MRIPAAKFVIEENSQVMSKNCCLTSARISSDSEDSIGSCFIYAISSYYYNDSKSPCSIVPNYGVTLALGFTFLFLKVLLCFLFFLFIFSLIAGFSNIFARLSLSFKQYSVCLCSFNTVQSMYPGKLVRLAMVVMPVIAGSLKETLSIQLISGSLNYE